VVWFVVADHGFIANPAGFAASTGRAAFLPPGD